MRQDPSHSHKMPLELCAPPSFFTAYRSGELPLKTITIRSGTTGSYLYSFAGVKTSSVLSGYGAIIGDQSANDVITPDNNNLGTGISGMSIMIGDDRLVSDLQINLSNANVPIAVTSYFDLYRAPIGTNTYTKTTIGTSIRLEPPPSFYPRIVATSTGLPLTVSRGDQILLVQSHDGPSTSTPLLFIDVTASLTLRTQ